MKYRMGADSKKSDSTRAAILDGAFNLFLRFGIGKTTMADIAAASGKAKSALYYYFKTKEDVFFSLVQKEINGVMDEIVQGAMRGTTAREKVRLYFSLRQIDPMVIEEETNVSVLDPMGHRLFLFRMLGTTM